MDAFRSYLEVGERTDYEKRVGNECRSEYLVVDRIEGNLLLE